MRKGFANIIAAVVIMGVMATSFLAGITVGQGHPTADYIIAGTPVPDDLQQPLGDLWQAYAHLNADSYWRPFPDHKALIYHAIDGMLSVANDPHTLFIPPTINRSITVQLNGGGEYGIGADVRMEPSGLRIIAPRIDSPALKAGLRPGDLIVAVDGKSLRGVKDSFALGLIHGQQGTVVSLSILRAGVARPFVVRVTRDTIPDVVTTLYGNIGYIAFPNFGEQTATLVHDALVHFTSLHIAGLIVDLRDNGGGYVDTAHAIAGEFLRRGAVINWERSNLGGNRYQDVAATVTAQGAAQHVPMVVLVNGNTASAAEIVTAALQENNRGHVLGTTTYGKGSVQEDLGLTDGSALRITIHLWLTPRKHQIQDRGITPDLAVKPGVAPDGSDLQIDRAIAYLRAAR